MKKSAVFGIIFAFTLIFGLIIIKGYEFYNARIFPRTYINSIAVGGLSIEEAIAKLEAAEFAVPSGEVVIAVDDIAVSSSSAELGLVYQYEAIARDAHLKGKDGGIFNRLKNIIFSFISSKNLTAYPTFDEEKLEQLLTDLQLKVDIIGEAPQATLGTSGNAATLTINPGSPGRILEVKPTVAAIQANIAQGEFSSSGQVASTSAVLNEEQIEAAKARAEKFVGYRIEFTTDTRTYALPDRELIAALTFPQGYEPQDLENIFSEWAKNVNREPQNAIFDYNSETLEVNEFVPHKNGLKLNLEEAVGLTTHTLRLIEEDAIEGTTISHPLPVAEAQPEITLADTNDLGIIERIGFGDSEYAHSIPNRVHNVKLTTDRISNIIIPPGEEFSFNKTLGEVSARTGYRSAYVIKNGRTELGDGGGVCQVSTTVFRSVLNAGLPVTLRLPHSYRVSYYELDSKPGIDATVYAGNVDFRFKNDTGQHLLLHGQADSSNLYMYIEIYGTSDGRTSEIVNHQVWDYRPPPAPEYFEDPEKPAGYREQVDWSAAGIKARFTNVVRDKDGNVIEEKEYYSNYRPWSAKFVVGPGGNPNP